MKIYGIWTSNCSLGVQDRPGKKSILGSGPWVISYRLSHKSPQSVNSMKSSSKGRRTDKVQKIAYFKKNLKYAKKLSILLIILEYIGNEIFFVC
jgi:hypothetical protein